MVDITVLADEPYPAAALTVGGLLSIFIAIYGRRDDSYLDELGTFFAFLLGAAMFVMAFFVGTEGTTSLFTLGVIVVLAVTLFLKPLKEIRWSAIAGAVIGGIAAIGASMVLPSEVFGVEEWIILMIVFFVVGAIIHMLFHFLEDLLAMATMVLSWKPVMVLTGLVALAEGIALFLDSSLASFL